MFEERGRGKEGINILLRLKEVGENLCIFGAVLDRQEWCDQWSRPVKGLSLPRVSIWTLLIPRVLLMSPNLFLKVVAFEYLLQCDQVAY